MTSADFRKNIFAQKVKIGTNQRFSTLIDTGSNSYLTWETELTYLTHDYSVKIGNRHNPRC